MEKKGISRREFLKKAGSVGLGMALGLSLFEKRAGAASLDAEKTEPEEKPAEEKAEAAENKTEKQETPQKQKTMEYYADKYGWPTFDAEGKLESAKQLPEDLEKGIFALATFSGTSSTNEDVIKGFKKLSAHCGEEEMKNYLNFLLHDLKENFPKRFERIKKENAIKKPENELMALAAYNYNFNHASKKSVSKKLYNIMSLMESSDGEKGYVEKHAELFRKLRKEEYELSYGFELDAERVDQLLEDQEERRAFIEVQKKLKDRRLYNQISQKYRQEDIKDPYARTFLERYSSKEILGEIEKVEN